MRVLKKEEVKSVSGGTLFLLGGLLRAVFGGYRGGNSYGGGSYGGGKNEGNKGGKGGKH